MHTQASTYTGDGVPIMLSFYFCIERCISPIQRVPPTQQSNVVRDAYISVIRSKFKLAIVSVLNVTSTNT